MGSLFSKKKTKKKVQAEYSPRTAQALYDARRTSKPIYPPLSSIPREEPKRFVRPDGRPLYESVHMDSDFDDDNRSYENIRYRASSHFPNYYHQYNDGTFTVLARQPMSNCGIYRV